MECTFRMALATDIDRIVEIQHSEPSPAILGLAGDVAHGRRFGAALVKTMGVTDPVRPYVVCETKGLVVGFAQYSIGESDDMPMNFRLIANVVRALGFRVFSMRPRLVARKAVRIEVPSSSFYIGEIQVHPSQRGSGIGAQLLQWLDAEATRQHTPMMSLITDIENPARRLYERLGFAAVETRVDKNFERYTARTGRVLMTKPASVS